MKPKQTKIIINPREPLTRKARAAIERYCVLQGRAKGNYFFVIVKACLEAERMKRENLYRLLEKKGFRWQPKSYFWKEINAAVNQDE